MVSLYLLSKACTVIFAVPTPFTVSLIFLVPFTSAALTTDVLELVTLIAASALPTVSVSKRTVLFFSAAV